MKRAAKGPSTGQVAALHPGAWPNAYTITTGASTVDSADTTKRSLVIEINSDGPRTTTDHVTGFALSRIKLSRIKESRSICAVMARIAAVCVATLATHACSIQSNEPETQQVIQQVTGEPNKIVVAGNTHTCALLDNGGVQCWGGNSDGQLGNGTTPPTPTHFERVQVTGLASGVSSISAGGSHTCAVLVGGNARCWGDNSQGQLGNGPAGNDNTSLPDSSVPVDVTNLPNTVQAISAGALHTCEVVAPGAARCWGDNQFGQLGDGLMGDRHSPFPVQSLSSGVQAITAGTMHSCAIVNGAAKCWGFNGPSGLLGNGRSDQNILPPVPVLNLTSGVTAIAAGEGHTCALVNGSVKCWGGNSFHQLGDGTDATSVPQPVPVSGLDSGVVAIAAGGNHTCAVLTSGAIRCWGGNGSGELGGPGEPRTPITVTNLGSGGLAIGAGNLHSCAIGGGSILCWGRNASGQLGVNPATTPQSAVPIPLPGVTCTTSSPISCVVNSGCADGTIEQVFGNGMIGCAGAVAFASRSSLCGPRYQPATAAQWTANRGTTAPTHNYWTNDQLRYTGDASSACFVSTSTGTSCAPNTPMRVCTGTGSDAEGNSCVMTHCGLNANTPDQFFGGCMANINAGALCVPAPVCGDGTCNSNESCASCPEDCGECPCGDGACDGGESCDSCPLDCGGCDGCPTGTVDCCGDGGCAPPSVCRHLDC